MPFTHLLTKAWGQDKIVSSKTDKQFYPADIYDNSESKKAYK